MKYLLSCIKFKQTISAKDKRLLQNDLAGFYKIRIGIFKKKFDFHFFIVLDFDSTEVKSKIERCLVKGMGWKRIFLTKKGFF